jgi:hypothetical protein
MMTLGDLCARVAGKVPLVLEIKSRFDGDRTLVSAWLRCSRPTKVLSRRCRSIPIR